MYARLVRRSLWQRKSRALVALAALTVATTLTAALLNLYFDATRKLRYEFRRYGANLMLTPRAAAGTQLLEAGLAAQLEAEFVPAKLSVAVPYLYAVVEARGESVVLAGTRLESFARPRGFAAEAGPPPARGPPGAAWVGASVARRFGLKPGDSLVIRYRDAFQALRVEGVLSTGAAEDNQVLAALATVGRLPARRGLNTILARAEGDAAGIEQTAAALGARFPAAAVNPLRQVTGAEVRGGGGVRWGRLGGTPG